MIALVLSKLLSRAKTRGTYVDAISRLAHWICTLDSDGVREVAVAAIALDLEARLINGCLQAFT